MGGIPISPISYLKENGKSIGDSFVNKNERVVNMKKRREKKYANDFLTTDNVRHDNLKKLISN
jgi:hypothetical protein